MRKLKSLLVLLIGLTALLYALQNLTNVGEMRHQIEGLLSGTGTAAPGGTLFGSTSLTVNWVAFGALVLFELILAAVALKGAWDLFAARKGTGDEFKAAKTIPVWAGGLSLVLWFGQSLMIAGGLFQWGTEAGPMALTKAFELSTTSALTILFVWGTTD